MRNLIKTCQGVIYRTGDQSSLFKLLTCCVENCLEFPKVTLFTEWLLFSQKKKKKKKIKKKEKTRRIALIFSNEFSDKKYPVIFRYFFPLPPGVKKVAKFFKTFADYVNRRNAKAFISSFHQND